MKGYRELSCVPTRPRHCLTPQAVVALNFTVQQPRDGLNADVRVGCHILRPLAGRKHQGLFICVFSLRVCREN